MVFYWRNPRVTLASAHSGSRSSAVEGRDEVSQIHGCCSSRRRSGNERNLSPYSERDRFPRRGSHGCSHRRSLCGVLRLSTENKKGAEQIAAVDDPGCHAPCGAAGTPAVGREWPSNVRQKDSHVTSRKVVRSFRNRSSLWGRAHLGCARAAILLGRKTDDGPRDEGRCCAAAPLSGAASKSRFRG
jgi:hypothetical protein